MKMQKRKTNLFSVLPWWSFIHRFTSNYTSQLVKSYILASSIPLLSINDILRHGKNNLWITSQDQTFWLLPLDRMEHNQKLKCGSSHHIWWFLRKIRSNKWTLEYEVSLINSYISAECAICRIPIARQVSTWEAYKARHDKLKVQVKKF